jgi:curli biogenesis system outer membrane secretion channel CsgG
MRLKVIAGLATVLAFAGLAADAQAQSKRPLVAVMDFDYGTVDNWWGQYDIGKGMADQVVDALLEDGSFRVIERKKLDTVMAEQDFTNSDRADPKTTIKLGKLLGVRYIITGSITKFSTEKRGGGVRVKGIGLGGAKAKSEVALTLRMIDTTTGEILISAKGLGSSSKGGGFEFAKDGFGVGTNSEEWRQSGLGQAQEKATQEVVAALVAKKDRLE